MNPSAGAHRWLTLSAHLRACDRLGRPGEAGRHRRHRGLLDDRCSARRRRRCRRPPLRRWRRRPDAGSSWPRRCRSDCPAASNSQVDATGVLVVALRRDDRHLDAVGVGDVDRVGAGDRSACVGSSGVSALASSSSPPPATATSTERSSADELAGRCRGSGGARRTRSCSRPATSAGRSAAGRPSRSRRGRCSVSATLRGDEMVGSNGVVAPTIPTRMPVTSSTRSALRATTRPSAASTWITPSASSRSAHVGSPEKSRFADRNGCAGVPLRSKLRTNRSRKSGREVELVIAEDVCVVGHLTLGERVVDRRRARERRQAAGERAAGQDCVAGVHVEHRVAGVAGVADLPVEHRLVGGDTGDLSVPSVKRFDRGFAVVVVQQRERPGAVGRCGAEDVDRAGHLVADDDQGGTSGSAWPARTPGPRVRCPGRRCRRRPRGSPGWSGTAGTPAPSGR